MLRCGMSYVRFINLFTLLILSLSNEIASAAVHFNVLTLSVLVKGGVVNARHSESMTSLVFKFNSFYKIV